MLDHRENAIKAILIDELNKSGVMTYKEKRSIRDQVDRAFIENQMLKNKSNKHICLVVFSILVALVIFWSVGLYLEGAEIYLAIQPFILFYGFWVVSDIYSKSQKRMMIYRILGCLEDQKKQSTDQKT